MVETVISDYMSLHWDLELEDSKPVSLGDTLAFVDASPYQVWLQKVQQLRRYRQDEHSLEFCTFPVTFTLTTIKQTNLFTRHSSLWWCANQSKFSCKRIGSFGRYIRKSYFEYMVLHCDLDLKDSEPICTKDTPLHGPVEKPHSMAEAELDCRRRRNGTAPCSSVISCTCAARSRVSAGLWNR